MAKRPSMGNRTLFIGLMIIFITVILVVILVIPGLRQEVQAPQNLSESEPTATYKDGQTVEMTGDVVCLQHRDQSGPITMECAFGFLDSESDKYYALRDSDGAYPTRIANLQTKEILKIKGIYKNNPDQKYQQEGTIELISVEE